MQATSASSLFQSTASLEIGLSRASKAARTSAGSQYGSPIWLGRKQEDLNALAEGAAGADGGADKVLALEVERDEGGGEVAAWVASSGGLVRRIDLETGTITHSLRAHNAPVSGLCLYPVAAGRLLLVTSSWDKSIRFWTAPSRLRSAASASKHVKASLQQVLTIKDAGSDFIKALHVLSARNQEVLLSGGSDKIVRVWDLAPLKAWAASLQDSQWLSISSTETSHAPQPAMLHAFREHTRPITCFASFAPRPGHHGPSSEGNAATSQPIHLVYSADSMGKVLELELSLQREGATSARLEVKRELVGNETGVVDLSAGWGAEEDEDENGEVRWTAELWTASHDKMARLWLPDSETAASGSGGLRAAGSSSQSGQVLGRLAPLNPSRRIEHSSYVKVVLPLAHLASHRPDPSSEALRDMLVTGETDGDLRVWHLTSQGWDQADESTEDTLAGQPTTRRTIQGEAVQAGPGARLIRTLEAHWHEVIVIRPWWRNRRGPLPDPNQEATETQEIKVEPAKANQGEWWLITAGLDGSVRRWRVADIVTPASPLEKASDVASASQNPSSIEKGAAKKADPEMTEEEERELQELMDED
ncbi:hypothetical protein CBOM_01444 [Ceraceosorus bombacis]|uniref:Uncharacterized protein n=1 Tax=Ceraceosorus bombacis TaxID=401625 RepID=A0A0P1BDG5_9BASI|nr:hypothetical protein CBOM_01444 [Ceraceosorus bombacis]